METSRINLMSVNEVKKLKKYSNKSSLKNERDFIQEENMAMDLSCALMNNRTITSGISVLRDITNNRFVEDEGKAKTCSHRRKNEVARERWKMLAKALLKPKKSTLKLCKLKDISVRRFATFNLVVPHKLDKLEKLDGCWLKYFARVINNVYQVEIHHLEQRLTPKELIGFNNTGNICIWPSEEVLAFYVLSKVTSFRGKAILEVGGGMTCLAGLVLAKYGRVKLAHLTDGNLLSVENVRSIISRNDLDKSKTAAFRLDWQDHRRLTKEYDVVLSSDCLFFDETRADLVQTIWNSLREDGVALVMAPRRGSTLDSFVQLAVDKGFSCVLHTHYEDTVWKRHLSFKKLSPEYEENLHYPVLLLLSKSHQETSFIA